MDSFPLFPFDETQLTPIGWQCPVCKRVYAPHVDSCECDTENVNVSEWLNENGELARSD